ncbi:MAG: EAL domain-containing protein [Steroidobacteraceae bacterium]|nr:EAL domain-containing protein [Steroidobacteraceae bacterium]
MNAPPAHSNTLLDAERAFVFDAIRGGGIAVAYQPVASRCADGSWLVTGVEALMRPTTPALGWSTDVFLRACARFDALGELFRHVLDVGLGQLRAWDSRGLELRLAVNLHAGALADPALGRDVADALARHSLPGERLLLELGEGAAIDDFESADRSIACLRALGVRIAIDDFGAGLGSLTRIDLVECDEIKIDRSLVTGLERSAELRRACANAIAQGHARFLKVCAEGVEKPETLAVLERLGCDRVQGFMIGTAVPPEELPALCFQWNAGLRVPGAAGA